MLTLRLPEQEKVCQSVNLDRHHVCTDHFLKKAIPVWESGQERLHHCLHWALRTTVPPAGVARHMFRTRNSWRAQCLYYHKGIMKGLPSLCIRGISCFFPNKSACRILNTKCVVFFDPKRLLWTPSGSRIGRPKASELKRA